MTVLSRLSPRWPDLNTALRRLVPPDSDLVLRMLVAADVERLIVRLRQWQPARSMGSAASLLDPAFYASQVYLSGSGATLSARPSVVVLAERAGEIVSCVVLTAEDGGRALCGAMTLVSPAASGQGLGGCAARTTVAVGRAIGADLAYALAELDDDASRKVLEASGMSLCAVIPAPDRAPRVAGEPARVPEAMYGLSLVPPAARVLPGESTVTPAVAAMFRGLYGVEPLETRTAPVAVGPRSTGVDPGCRLVPLRDLFAQRAAEAEGLVVLGLVPGTDRHTVGGALRFGFDALYGRSADGLDVSVWPGADRMPPRLAALVSLVRGAKTPGARRG